LYLTLLEQTSIASCDISMAYIRGATMAEFVRAVVEVFKTSEDD